MELYGYSQEYWDDQLERCISLAIETHYGQRDKAGEIYILHPLHVMGCMTTTFGKCVGVGHDILEDSELESQDAVTTYGIDASITSCWSLLTRSEGTKYKHYIGHIAHNEFDSTMAKACIEAKIHDLEHNLMLSKFARSGEVKLNYLQQSRYISALHILQLTPVDRFSR